MSINSISHKLSTPFKLGCDNYENDNHYQYIVNDNHYQITREINEKNDNY